MARRTKKPQGPSPVRLEEIRFCEHVFYSAGVGAFVSDREGKITHANPAMEELLGRPPGTLAGHVVGDLLPHGAKPRFPEVIADGRSWSGTLDRRSKSGAVFPSRATISPVRDEVGEAASALHLMVDDAVDQRCRRRLAALSSLRAALNAEIDLEALLARICQEARELFGVSGVYISRLDERARELIRWASSDPASDLAVGQRVPVFDEDETLGRVLDERQATVARHVRPEGAYAELIAAYGVRSVLLAPLRSGGRVLGVLVLIDAEHDDRFGAEDEELAQAFADLAAAAIEGARLHQAERAKRERLMMLARVNQLLAASLELEEVLEAIANGARRLLGVDDVIVRLLDAATQRLHLAYVTVPTGLVPWSELEMDTSKMGEVLRDGRAWQTEDLMTETLDSNGQRRFWAAASRELHGCLIIPLIARGRPLGGIAILTKETRTFDDDEVELAQGFADQAALAVQNAETLARERRASRFEQIAQRARALEPGDRLHVERMLAAAERALELTIGPGGESTC